MLVKVGGRRLNNTPTASLGGIPAGILRIILEYLRRICVEVVPMGVLFETFYSVSLFPPMARLQFPSDRDPSDVALRTRLNS